MNSLVTQAINGSFNDDLAVNNFFDGVRKFVRAGIPVVVVGHSSSKSGQYGKSDQPMGSSAIVGAVRHRIFVKRSHGFVILKVAGNHVKPFELKLRHGDGAVFEVVEDVAYEVAKLEKQQQRQARTLDENRRIAEWVMENCQGMSRRAAAQALVDSGEFTLGFESLRRKLGSNGPVGKLLVGKWVSG